ncbi:MFS transporter [Denitratisoma sp. DHT3]|uniref:MFS transporter n=1 Tax=Denitratisoma sp. DHT3 TaxID=1981880 RepID=UPI001645D5B6|nr:MFS transporter [Denitratisoma sp. DHT3]
MFYGWKIVAVAMLALGLSCGVASYSFGLLVLPVSHEFGATRMEIMWALTACSLATMLLSPMAGTLMDKRSARSLFVIGTLFLAASLFLISFSRHVWEFILVYGLVMSLGSTLLGPLGANTLVARWFSRGSGRAMGITAMGTSLGGFFVPLILQALIDEHGWRRACFYLGGIVTLLLLPPIIWLVCDNPSDLDLHPDGEPGLHRHQRSGVGLTQARLPNLWKDASFWRISLAVGASMATFTAMLANLVPFAIGHGVASKQAALLVSVISMAGFGGKVLFSVFADRINLKYCMLTALLMAGLPMLLLVWFHEFPIIVLAAISVGLSSGAFLPAWGALVARVYGPLIFGRVMGFMQPVTIVMVILAIPMVGHLYDLSGSYSAGFLVLVSAVGLAILGFLPLRLTHQ